MLAAPSAIRLRRATKDDPARLQGEGCVRAVDSDRDDKAEFRRHMKRDARREHTALGRALRAASIATSVPR
jgi:hypothetical protein